MERARHLMKVARPIFGRLNERESRSCQANQSARWLSKAGLHRGPSRISGKGVSAHRSSDQRPGEGEEFSPFRGRWDAVACLASGPSLCGEDIEAIRNWRFEDQEKERRAVIVVNTTFLSATWADVLFAMDKPWWDKYAQEVNEKFQGQRLTILHYPKVHAVKLPESFKTFGNSGSGAIAAAILGGARRICLLGYDSQRTYGKVHHHGDHPRGLGNAGAMPKWPAQFKALREAHPDVDITNCSRETALTCFPRKSLLEWM